MRDMAKKADCDRRRKLSAMNYHGVELYDCLQKRQFDEACETFYNVSNDSLLYPFRIRKELDAPGKPLEGWYGEGLFINLGYFFTTFARIYAATGDKKFYHKLRTLLTGWEETIDEDGFGFTSIGANAKEYTFDKFVWGLLDAYEYAGIVEALKDLKAVSAWMLKNGATTHSYADVGMDSITIGQLEWYTLSEGLLRAFHLTGDPMYRELAGRYFYDEYYEFLYHDDFDGLMKHVTLPGNPGSYQANSHLLSLNSAAMKYYLEGDEKYLHVIKNAYDMIRRTQAFVTGMFGPLEGFMKPRQRTEALHSEDAHSEVSCPSWALMRLTRHLIELTGDGKYGDWMELNIYNGIGAAPPTRKDGRYLQYFADYGLDRATKKWGVKWSCCAVSSPISVAEYYNQIYYKSEDSLRVCLYLPSSAEHEINGEYMRIRQATAFPNDDRVKISVETKREVRGKLGFRIPGWLKSPMKISINGVAHDYTKELNWATIDKPWQNGDEICIDLPMELELCPVEPEYYDRPVAMRYGPVALVIPQGAKTPRIDFSDMADIVQHFRRTSGDGLEFESQTRNGSHLSIAPYYAIPPDAPYTMYVDGGSRRSSFEELEYGGDKDSWKKLDAKLMVDPQRRTAMVSDIPGAFFSKRFRGTGVIWCGYFSTLAGYAQIYIDDVLVDKVTQYSRWTFPPWLWSKTDLAPGEHTIKVVVAAEKCDRSNGNEVNVKHLRFVD